MNEKIVETLAKRILSPEEMVKYEDALKEGKSIVKYLGMKEKDKAPNDGNVEPLVRDHTTLTDRYHFLNKFYRLMGENKSTLLPHQKMLKLVQQ